MRKMLFMFWVLVSCTSFSMAAAAANDGQLMILHDARGGIVLSDGVAVDSFKGALSKNHIDKLKKSNTTVVTVNKLSPKSLPKTSFFIDENLGRNQLRSILGNATPLGCNPIVCDPRPEIGDDVALPKWRWNKSVLNTHPRIKFDESNNGGDPSPKGGNGEADCMTKCHTHCTSETPECESKGLHCVKVQVCDQSCTTSC